MLNGASIDRRPGSRRRSPLDSEQEAYLRRYVAENRPTTDEVIAFLRDTWELRYSQTGVRNVLARIGAYLPFGRLRGMTPRPRARPRR